MPLKQFNKWKKTIKYREDGQGTMAYIGETPKGAELQISKVTKEFIDSEEEETGDIDYLLKHKGKWIVVLDADPEEAKFFREKNRAFNYAFKN